MEFITLTQDDPRFAAHLDGTFSRTKRALPIETYHPQTPKERVTFRILPLEQVDRPFWWKIYFLSCRPELLPLTLGPAVAAWLAHLGRLEDWRPWPSWLALMGLFFLHTSIFLFNDVQDHLHGYDRLNRRRGSQVIQKGWVRAVDMKRWAWLNGALALALAVPAFWATPWQLLGICSLALLALVLVMRGVAVRWGLADLALILLFGPLLTAGIVLASFTEVGWADVLLGGAFGLITAWTLQVRQFENLFRSRPEGFRTFIGHLAFDRAKQVVVIEGVLLLSIQALFAYWLEVAQLAIWLVPFAVVPSVILVSRMARAASPLSSRLVGSEWWALGSQLAWTLWWMVAVSVSWV